MVVPTKLKLNHLQERINNLNYIYIRIQSSLIETESFKGMIKVALLKQSHSRG
jgi:hypothetical protein